MVYMQFKSYYKFAVDIMEHIYKLRSIFFFKYVQMHWCFEFRYLHVVDLRGTTKAIMSWNK